MKTVYLSLGANLGDRAGALARALAALEQERVHVLRVSPLYETEPMGRRSQPWFLNQVAEAETDLFPAQLLSRTQAVERALGRRRALAGGPRIIDIDILFFGGFVIDTPRLTVPHPRFRERRFVLAPMADLAPDFRDPVSRQTMRELLAAVAGQTVRRVGSVGGTSG